MKSLYGIAISPAIITMLLPMLRLVMGKADDLNFYSFPVMDINGDIVSLSQYKGKVSLVVNVASECGYTDNHYSGLVTLQDVLGPTGKFNVLAFPCNQFGHQEPGPNEAIQRFATQTYRANFPMFGKVNVKGRDALDAWSYLIKESGKEPDWNFWKYLVDHEGHVIDAWGPFTPPEKLYNSIKKAVDKAQAADGTKDRGGEL